MVTSTAATPGTADTAARAWSRSASFAGQAGVVSSMVNATRPPSICRPFTKPSVTMSRWRSGSFTLRSASNTAVSSTDDMGTSFVDSKPSHYLTTDYRGAAVRRSGLPLTDKEIAHATIDASELREPRPLPPRVSLRRVPAVLHQLLLRGLPGRRARQCGDRHGPRAGRGAGAPVPAVADDGGHGAGPGDSAGGAPAHARAAAGGPAAADRPVHREAAGGAALRVGRRAARRSRARSSTGRSRTRRPSRRWSPTWRADYQRA